MLQRFENYGRACLVAAVFLSAVAIDVGASDAFSLVKLTILWTLGILAIGFWFASATTCRKARQLGAIEYLTFGFLAICGIATLTSIAPRVSLLGLPGRYNGLLPIVLYAAMMFACVGLFRSRPERLSQLAWGAVAAGGLIGAYVCIQAAGLDPGHWSDPSTRLRPDWPIGTLGNSNFAGGYLAIVLPFSIFALLTRRSNVARYTVSVLIGIEVLGLWYTQTRGGMIAAGCALFLMGVAGRRQLPRWFRRAGAGLVVAAGLAAIMVVWHPGFRRAPGLLDRVRTSTLESRLAFWQVGVDVAIDHPVTGTGLDTFYASYPPRRPAKEARQNGLQLPDAPHNIFVGYASNTGIGGGACYVALVLVACGMAWRTLRHHQRVDPLLLGFFGALVAYIVQGIFSIDEPPLAVTGWLCIGAVVVLARAGRTKSGEERTPRVPAVRPIRARSMLYGLVAAGVAVLLFLGVQPLRASAFARRGDFQQAMRIQPLDFTYPLGIGDLNRFVALSIGDPSDRLAHLQVADRYYRVALRLNPGELDVLLKLAVTNSIWADSVDVNRFPEAQRWWGLARRADPRDPELLAEYNDSVASMRTRGGELAQVAVADQDNVAEWVDAAQAFAFVGDVQRARDLVRTALLIDPSNEAGRRLADALPS